MARRKAWMAKKGKKKIYGRKRRIKAIRAPDVGNSLAAVRQALYSRLATPLPNKLKVSLRYSDNQLVVNPTSTNVVNIVFKANDMYDPYDTGGGHQPRGFDQLIAMYDHFQVIGSKITVQMNESPTTLRWGILLSDTAVGPVIQTDALEYPSANSVHGSTKVYEPTCLSLAYSQKKFFGHRDLEQQFEGRSSGSPTELAYFNVYAMSSSTADPANVYFTVTIDYIAILTEPHNPAQS